ncbi:MAG: hypothetical protein ACLSHX_10700 [Suilimivivens sp.]
MVILTEQIEIPASYEKMEAWIANFEEEFVKWSPYHIECNLYNGNYQVGNKIRFCEIVMGLDYDVTGTITECEQDENHCRIVFRSDKKTAFITFEGKKTETGCHFSHTEAFGMTTPAIGAIMNFLIFKVFFRKKANWQFIRDDMILDNRYLYEILTEGKYPERIPRRMCQRACDHGTGMHKVDQGSVVNAGDSNIDDNPTICEYWVGLWECVARSNP